MTRARSRHVSSPQSFRRERLPLNGVNTPALLDTWSLMKSSPELAELTFRAKNEWLGATHSRTTFGTFSAADALHIRDQIFVVESDHPTVLVGADRAPTPVEHLLHALASCLMSGIGNISAAQGVRLDSVECEISGQINRLGLLGLSDQVRPGYRKIALTVTIRGDGTEEQLRAIVERSRARSAVYDLVSRGVPVTLETKT